ncbi:MAG: PadR family transcriptional regulator [Anaerolineales bacterium]|nr:PadR family transcriptional regulator [Anaerolineales bacterium]
MLKYALLGLLARDPKHGYDLKNGLEQALGGHWEINFGQIYSTLGRMERDKLVEVAAEDQDGRGKKTYQITLEGRQEFAAWIEAPVEKPRQFRDEFFIKLVVGRLAGIPDPAGIIDRQRQAYLTQLRDLTAMAARAGDADIALMIEGAILHLQADLRWLDLCDERLERGAAGTSDTKRSGSGKE